MSSRNGKAAGDVLARLRAAATEPRRAVGTDTSDAVSVQGSEAVPAAPSGAVGKLRPRTMRYTIDFTPEERRALRAWADDHLITNNSEIIRALIRLLERDPVLSDRVLEEIARGAADG
jgi:hypothetical protein